MKKNIFIGNGYQAYLLGVLGKEPTPVELIDFINNQDLLLITRRKSENDVYHIAYKIDTRINDILDGILLGGVIQLHSQQAGHMFYSVFFEAKDENQEHYLILDAIVDAAIINGCNTQLINSIKLITVEDLVLDYSPTACYLN